MPCCLGCCCVLKHVFRWLTCACSASQQLAPCRVADRAALVIDIFSQAAKTKEGQLQVHACSAIFQVGPLGTRCTQHKWASVVLWRVCARCTWRSSITSCPG